MKRLTITLAIVAASALAFGQSKKTEILDITSRVVTNAAFNTERSTIFLNSKNEPVLIFKDNGDIIYKGKKLISDTAIVNGLKKALTGERRVK